MTYAFAFSSEAFADFAQLPTWLQEELLDVLDSTAESLPARTRPRSLPSLVIDHRTATLRVLRIGHYSRAE